MSDDDLSKELQTRLLAVETKVSATCAKANRPRTDVRLIAVTKTVSARVASLLPNLEITDLGESRPQELRRKAETLPKTIHWHMIGHLQRNKLEEVLPYAELIHSIDSIRLLEAVSAYAKKYELKPNILLQINASREEQKHGFQFEKITTFKEQILTFPGTIQGLMGMAAYSDNPDTARPAFQDLRRLRDELQQSWSLPLPELSMGMSGDFEVAIEEGSTMIRIGSSLFEGLETE